MREQTFSMPALPPFRLDLTVWALRRRADNSVDRWDGHTYRRVLTLDSGNVEVAAVQAGSATAPRLVVTLTGTRVDRRSQEGAANVLTRLLGLNIDLDAFYELAARDSLLGALSARFRGVKPPRFPTLFECIVNAIACQQLTLTVGITILNRLADRYGVATGSGDHHAFPRPARLAGLAPVALRTLGFSGAKARSIVELAETMTAGRFDPEALDPLDDHAVLAALLHLRGVGRWTGEYALLRGFGRLHVFPGDDVGARNNLARWLDRHESLDYSGVQVIARQWRPYAGFVYFHLLLANLADRGVLGERTIAVP